MKVKFTKMQGCGNDYVYINGFTEKIDQDKKKDFVIAASDRHFGIGSDGVIFINPSDTADFEMEMYNADGSRSEMCGNGIRCVAKYVYDKGMIDKKEFTIESYGKTKVVNIVEADSEARLIRIDMGEPELVPERIPVKIDHADDKVVDQPISADDRDYRMTCVSMGNPHAVIFLDPEGLDIDSIGPSLENHSAFPNRANIEFVRVDDRSNVHMRVWERGTGETLACGTGCCATAVSCILNGLTDRKVTVHVLGGDIIIEWNEEDGHVYMTGPAVTVFSGEIELQ